MTSKFVPPTEAKKLEAIGLEKDSTYNSYFPYIWKRGQTGNRIEPPIKYFNPNDFPDIPKPKRGDWLRERKEPGQSFKRFSTGQRCHPIPRKNVIYIVPLELYAEQKVDPDCLKTLCSYAGIFFGLPVKCMKPVIDLDGKGALKSVSRRINEDTGEPQANASEIMAVLKGLKPKDAFCICGITLCDIYPKDDWNFVFGLASTMDETGVYSLARYLPETREHPMLLRAVRVMCHEICHMFGMKHCVYFSCLMNGSNHAKEAISRPTFLCPVCLRKLYFVCSFDIRERYQGMLNFWENIPSLDGSDKPKIYADDIEWLRGRLSK